MAGGRSSRMGGEHKGFLIFENETFMERLISEMKSIADRVWISYGKDVRAEYAGCQIVMDEQPGCGPISGILAGLRACESEELCVAACDMPFLKSELFLYLQEKLSASDGMFDGAVPVVDGKVHPLAAIYKKSALRIFEEQIQCENYRLVDALKKMDIVYVDVSGHEKFVRMLQNINTIEEYKELWKC